MYALDFITGLSAGLFGLTALLLLGATYAGQTPLGRVLALASIASVCVANYAMLVSYQGEKSWESEWAGPIERRVLQRRGGFEYVDKGDAGTDGAGGGVAGPSQAGSSGGTEGSGAMAGGTGATVSRGASGLLSRLGLAAQAADADPAQVALRDCPDCPDMVVIRPGFLQMGAGREDRDAQEAERPRRLVKVGRAFAIGREEVRVGQYMAFVRATGRAAPGCQAVQSGRSGSAAPVGCVSFQDAVDYIGWLNALTGRGYRLPTEAEWEWAARGGSSERFVTGPELKPVGVNGFGLSGIHGGVAEIVAGCWSATLREVPGDAAEATRRGNCTLRVVRDGAAGEPAASRRLSARRSIGAREALDHVGFRVARDL